MGQKGEYKENRLNINLTKPNLSQTLSSSISFNLFTHLCIQPHARENAEHLPNVSLLEGGEEAVREDVFVGLIPLGLI